MYFLSFFSVRMYWIFTQCEFFFKYFLSALRSQASVEVVQDIADAALHHPLLVVWDPADTVNHHLSWTVALSGFARICWYVNTGAFLFFEALYSVHLIFLSWDWHSSGLISSYNTVVKSNGKNLQLLEDCCICTAGFQISNWGACGQINHTKKIYICILFTVNCGNKKSTNCPNNIGFHFVSNLII